MFSAMRKLILKKFYATSEAAQNKIDVFYAVNRLTDEEYAELAALILEVYGEEEETQE